MTVMDWVTVGVSVGGALLGGAVTGGIFMGRLIHRIHILERDYAAMQARLDRLFNGRSAS